MPKKMGRPKIDNPKNYEFRIRLDEKYKAKLINCAEKKNISKSDVVRLGIELVEKSIEGK